MLFWKEFAEKYLHNTFINKNKSQIFYPYLFAHFHALANLHERDWNSDKKENLICLIYKEIQTNGLLIYGEIFEHFPIY